MVIRNLVCAIFILWGAISLMSCTDVSDNDSADIQQYIGVWSVSDKAAKLNYTATITTNPSNSSEILIKNFAGLGETAVVLVIGNSLVIDSQPQGMDYTVEGSGSYINSKKLIIDFDISDGIDSQARIATYTR